MKDKDRPFPGLIQQPESTEDRVDLFYEIEEKQYEWDWHHKLYEHKIFLTPDQANRLLGVYAPTPYHTLQDVIVLLATKGTYIPL